MNTKNNIPKIGDKIWIKIKSKNNKKVYDSQILNCIDDVEYIISGPIKKSTFIPLHVDTTIDIMYYKQDKGRFKFSAKIKERNINKIYKLKILRQSKIMKIQERDYYRLPVKIDLIKIHHKGKGMNRKEIREDCLIDNISGGGLKIQCNYKHSVGDIVEFIFNIQNYKIESIGEIVRVQNSENLNYRFLAGVQFKQLKKEFREKIIRYIFNKQREMRRKGLI